MTVWWPKQRHHQRRQRQRHHLRRPWPHRPVGLSTLRILTTGYVTGIVTVQPNNGGADTINGGLDNDVILGGALADLITGGEGNDIVFGDHGAIDYVIDDSDFGDIDRMFTIDNAIGATTPSTPATATTSSSAASAATASMPAAGATWSLATMR
ncbi:hypothetical protein LP419_39760 [Massilia sp. H-1]|nr:hypothetical protein LP419_39760 [Massilia sp. H-1]